MKTVLKKIGRVLHEAIKMIIAVPLLAFMGALITAGLLLLPVLGITHSIFYGGSPWDNTCDYFEELMEVFNQD